MENIVEEKKYYYAVQCDPELYDMYCYFTEDIAMSRKIWLGGNRDYIDINSPLYDQGKDLLDKLAEVITYKNYYNKIRAKAKRNKKELYTQEKCLEIYNNISKYGTISVPADCRAICDMLELIYGEPFKYGHIDGCSQGDWLFYICPEETSQNYINWLESVVWGTGIEYEVSPKRFANWEEAEDNRINFGWITVYTDKYRDEEIKQYIADYLKCSVDEVKLRNIKATHHITTFDYEEV